MEKELVCIACPVGCRLNVTGEKSNLIVSGNECKRGELYAINELTDPKRNITTSIKVYCNDDFQMLSLMSSKEVPYDKIFDCIAEIKKLKCVYAEKICVGDVIIQNVLGLGVDIVSTREIVF